MQMLDLTGKLDTARRRLDQVELNNAALLTQLKTSRDARKEQLAKEEELLQRYRDQHQACKIYAPESGMVAYADSRYDDIAVGTHIRMRQKILSLPNLKRMQVRTAVHESVLDKVKAGQDVTVRVEASSELEYQGTVESVAVLPDSTSSSVGGDTRFYETIVKLAGEVEQLKPGMTAVVEIHVEHLQDVLTVPLQSVMEIDDQAFCYLSREGALHRQPLELGLANDHQVQVLEGIEAGAEVVLNPLAFHDDEPPSDGGTAE